MTRIGETKRTEADLLAFIDSYWEEFWTSPSYAQIGLFLGLSSKSSVHHHVHRLIEAGGCEKDARKDLRATLAEFIASPVPSEHLRTILRPYLERKK